jgi:putative ABC transport system ATP-binding protein
MINMPAFSTDQERPSSEGIATLSSPTGQRQPVIEMRDIFKVFKTQAGDFTALKGITTFFYPGEFVSVVGKSGSGKSTLVNMLTGIDHPTSGCVTVNGIPIHEMSESQMSIWRGQNLGIVFQFFQLLPMLTIRENIMLPMDLADSYPLKERLERADALLGLVGLTEVAEELPGAISGGLQQSAAIARALANDPPILIADEPTGNLDSRAAEDVVDIFTQFAGSGKTIIMVTHDPSLARRTSRTLLLSDGKLVDPQSADYQRWLEDILEISLEIPSGEEFSSLVSRDGSGL